MKIKTSIVPRHYSFTDPRVKALAEEVLQDSEAYIRALTDDE